MSAAPRYTLESLAAKAASDVRSEVGKLEELRAEHAERVVEKYEERHGYGWNVWVWLLVIFLIVLFVLWLLQPYFILSEDKCGKCCLDWGKLIIWSIVIALAICLLIWLFRGCGGTTTCEKKERC